MPRNHRVQALPSGLLSVCAMLLCAGDAAGQARLPQYRIEPPDILVIKVLKFVPLKSYRLEANDVLKIQVPGAMENQPIDGDYLVQNEFPLSLGPAYGSVKVVGLSIQEAAAEIERQLANVLKYPQVSLELVLGLEFQTGDSVVSVAGTQRRYEFVWRPKSPEFPVRPDGTVSLWKYGSARVQSKTVAEAKAAIDEHLSQFFQSIETDVKMSGYNRKVYYVVTEGKRLGDNVIRVPWSGEETVADALRQVARVPPSSVVKVSVARPADKDDGGNAVLAVDWVVLAIDWSAAARGPNLADTVRIQPGDRVFVEEKPVQADKAPAKVYRTAEPRRRLALRRRG